MNLIERKREEHRGRVFQRVGSVLVCMSLLLAVAFPPQEAKAAFVLDDMAVAAVAAAFLASCGMTFAASGMDSSGITEQVSKVIDSYLQEEFAGQSRMEWIGDAMSAGLSISRGQLALSSLLSNKLAALARWVQGEYGVESGAEVVVYSMGGYSKKLANGCDFYVGVCNGDTNTIYSSGTVVSLSDLPLSFADGLTVSLQSVNDTQSAFVYKRDDYSMLSRKVNNDSVGFFALYQVNDRKFLLFSDLTNSKLWWVFYDVPDFIFSDTAIEAYQSLDISSVSGISIPDTIPDNKEVTISTGAASDLTLDQALEQVLAAIAEGQLSATKEIADAGTAADDPAIPGEETIPDIEGLGLPALGAVFTTRFPFSIPWDIARGIKLLAAPAKTPRFEVDFFEPIRYRFGGNLGDTTIVLDFSEYEIIGQVSRWASTIGFCLLLAGGTKRLIWTA